jgi:S-(hydroxymethyl)glutathione dehydrogenase/alcohol dehydrogenase
MRYHVRVNVILGAGLAGAGRFVGVDFNPRRRSLAEAYGMTHFVNPKISGSQ